MAERGAGVIAGAISSLTDGGDGVLRADNEPVTFVPFTAPGDRVSVRIEHRAKNCSYGKLLRVEEPAPCRVEPDCPAFGRCGGCALRHISYEAELAEKRGWVENHLRRIGGIELPVPPVLPSPKIEGYRNKAIYPAAQGRDGAPLFGFYARKSHELVRAESCRLQPEIFSRILAAVRELALELRLTVYDEARHRGLLRAVYMRMAETTGSIVLCPVVNGGELPHAQRFCEVISARFPEVTGIVLNLNRERTNVVLGREWHTLWGSERLTDTLCGVELSISPASFYQVNRGAAELLYARAAEFAALTGSETLLDLYCGTGSIGLSMARAAGKLIGVEIVPQAVEDARQNARRCGIDNAEFICADASGAAKRLAERGERPDVVVLDPPRKGASPETLAAVAEMSPERIVMVSCSTATMARDFKLLSELGYEPRAVAPVDMFPRTANVECAALLAR